MAKRLQTLTEIDDAEQTIRDRALQYEIHTRQLEALTKAKPMLVKRIDEIDETLSTLDSLEKTAGALPTALQGSIAAIGREGAGRRNVHEVKDHLRRPRRL